MAPIKLGMIGLSGSGWAKDAHFPYLKKTSDYEIVAVQNSSVKSAETAIKSLELDEATKAYGTPEDIAKDPNVDLVICSVRAHLHAPSIRPALKAGKNVYVEWPLGRTLKETEELVALKNASGVKHAYVGLQDRHAPAVREVRSIIKSGKIGKVLSSNWNGYGHHGGVSTTETYEILGDRDLGGNLLTVHFGHALDYIQWSLGEGFKNGPKTTMANRRPLVALVKEDGTLIKAEHPTTAEDTIFLQGTLSNDIPISMAFRGGDPFKGQPALDWRIYGEKGEIRVTAPLYFMGVSMMLKVEHHDFASDTVVEVPLTPDEFEELSFPAANIARLYQGYRDTVDGKDSLFSRGMVTWEEALNRHKLMDAMYRENGVVLE